MTKHISMLVGAAIAICVSVPAVAQDYTGNVDPSEWSRPTVMESTIRAQTRSRATYSGQRSRAGLTAEAAATCANKRRAATNLGRSHPKVRQLYALCARAGY